MSNNELLYKISNKLKSKNNIIVDLSDIKLTQINKDSKVYEIPYDNIKIIYFRKSGTIMINSTKKDKLA